MRFQKKKENSLSSQPYRLCDFSTLIRDILLIYNLCTEEIFTETDLYTLSCMDFNIEEQTEKKFSELIFQNREAGKIHNPYDQGNPGIFKYLNREIWNS